MTELMKCNEDDNKLLELAWRCCFLAQRMLPSDLSNTSIERLGAIREAVDLIAIPEEYNCESAVELYQRNASFHALCTTLRYAYRAADRLAEEKAREALKDPATRTVLALAEKHRETWSDRDERYWLARLQEEVGELASAICGRGDDPVELELGEIGSIAINWLRRREALRLLEGERP
jgi:hypothetical protein